MLDPKHLVGGLIGAILAVALGLLASKGIDVQVPCSAPAAQASPQAAK
jgi:hypothetical protein